MADQQGDLIMLIYKINYYPGLKAQTTIGEIKQTEKVKIDYEYTKAIKPF